MGVLNAAEITAGGGAISADFNALNADSVTYASAASFSSSGLYRVNGQAALEGAISGSKPTKAALRATNKAGRLAALIAYYQTTWTLTGDVTLDGDILALKDMLIVSTAGATLTIRGVLKLDNVSFHNVQVSPDRGGVLLSTNTGFSCDSPSTGIYVANGSVADVPGLCIISPTTRGLMAFNGSVANITGGGVYEAGTDGLYILEGGNSSIIAASSEILFCGGNGAVVNYGGSMDLGAATITDNGGAGISAESNGAVYAVNANISRNGAATGSSGIFTIYGGKVQARGSTIQGNAAFGAYAQGGIIDILTATVGGAGALANNGGAVQIRAIRDGVIRSEAAGGSGKTDLTTASYDPPHDTVGNGIAYIGLGTADATAFRSQSLALTSNTASITFGVSADLALFRQAANRLALRNGTNAQSFEVYNTYTDASNYEGVKMYFSSNIARLDTIKAGTGTARDMLFQRDGSDKIRLRSTTIDFSSAMLLVPVTAPATPTTGPVIYCDSADGKVKIKDTGGIVTILNPIP